MRLPGDRKMSPGTIHRMKTSRKSPITSEISDREKHVATRLGLLQRPARPIAMLVKQAVEQQVDPYLTLVVLVESVVHTIAHGLPAQNKVEIAKGVTTLLSHRFMSQRLIR